MSDAPLDTFLADLAASVHEAGVQFLARTWLCFGGKRAFGHLELRSYYREDGLSAAGFQVLEEAYAPRSMVLNDQVQPYGSKDTLVHMPELYRVQVRPRTYDAREARKLHIWHPGHALWVDIEPDDTPQDVLAVPVTPSAKTSKDESNVAMPPLRIAEGAVDVRLDLKDNSLFQTHMEMNLAHAIVFGLFGFHLIGRRYWPVRITAQGIEFDATLPDPTRRYAGMGEVGDRIAVRLRLETLPHKKNLACPYVLRLIGPSLALDPDSSVVHLARLRDRLSQAAGSLVQSGNPAWLRVDTLGAIPPVFWPLQFRLAAGHNRLHFVSVPDNETEAVLQIDPAALDLRLATRSTHPEADTGLARVHLDEAAWLKETAGFRLAVRAGHEPGAVVTKPAATQTYALTYSRTDTVWSGSLTGQITDERVHVPLGLLVDRLTPLYRAAHAIAATETAPYAFLAVQDGWLQMPLDKAATQLGAADPVAGGPQAMTGRIVFFPDADGTEAATGLSIDDARRMGVDIHWQGEDPLAAQVNVIPEEPTGQFLGFLYAADTSPDARNAVPVWSAGDAATREVPLWFGLGAGIEPTATLTWSREAGTRWSLDFAAGSRLSEADDTRPSWLAWLSPGPHPFVTNYAMARTAQGVRAPSTTRGMVPYQVDGRAIMIFSAAATSDGTGNTLPRLTGPDGKVLPGPPVLAEEQPEAHAPLARSLLLPTLNGTESPVPSDTEMRDWTHMMRLRYDLPVLDDLFAWSDPPPSEPQPSPAVVPDATKVPEPLPPPPVVTALMPEQLAEIWRANEHRMRLTWTKDALVSNDLLGTNGIAHSVKFNKIAAPHPFHTKVAITLSPTTLLGKVDFIDLPEQPKGLEGALVGLGGRLRQGQKPLSLVLKNGELYPTALGETATVTVTGYAADHYVDPDLPKLMTDNRGSAVDPVGTPRLRAVAQRAAPGEVPGVKHLLTLARDQIVTSDQIKFGFAARDLPVTPGPGGLGYVFHGVSVDGQAGGPANPVEGSRSFDGQSFNAETLLDGLYEWRCYGFPGSGKKASKNVPAGYFEMDAGPFMFRPLRLILAEFDDTPKPTKVQILGSLTLGAAYRDPGTDFAFGADRVYDRDDLFMLTAVRDGSNWTTSLIAHNLDLSNTDTLHLIPLKAGEVPAVRFSRRVRSAGTSFFQYDGELPVSIALTFAPEATWPEITTAELRGHLFGADFRLTGAAMAGEKGSLKLLFDVPAPASTEAALRLEDLSVQVHLTDNGVGDTMSMSGSVVGAAHSGAAAAADLFRYTPTGLTWMDLSLPHASATPVSIDHAEGAIALNFVRLDVDKAISPLFGLVFPDMAKPKLTGSLAAVFNPGTTGVATAIMHVELWNEAGKEHLIRHELSHGPDDADRQNHLDITWTQKPEHPCPIRWPVGQDEVTLDPATGQQTLAEIGTGPLKPQAAQGGEPHRLLRLKPGGETLMHEVVLKLRAHRIPVDDLKRGDVAVVPVRTLRTMAVTHHRLTSDKTGKTVEWQGLDHVAITSAAAMRTEAGDLAFAPRMSARWHKGKRYRLWYRGSRVNHSQTPEGQAPISEANLSGFHDAGMVEHLWQDDVVPGPVILGGGVLRLPLGGEARAHVLNMPWVMGLPEGTALQSLSDDRVWRIATVDAWAAHAIAITGAGTLQGLNDRIDETEIRRHLGATSGPSQASMGDPTRLIPTDAGLFESWTAEGKEGAIDASLHAQAPYFLRAALALRSRWRVLLEGHDRWSAQSLVPQPWDISGSAAAVAKADCAALLQVIDVFSDRHLPTSDSHALMVTADIVALSRRGVTLVRGYRVLRSIHATDTGGVLVEMRQIADTLDHRARAALRQVRLPNGHSATLARILGRVDDPLAATADPLVRQVTDIGASPALGWPRPADDIAAALVPSFGPDRAVQAPEAGFSGRAQRVAWPARAIADSEQADGIYASFGQHVVFDRGDTPFAHDGPAGRHLAPVLPRRRGPVPVLRVGRALSPSRLDRLTIGRRPGAMEVSTTSLTLTRDTPGIRHVLDAGWPGMGRAADAAPVLAHGLRTPRSTVLPRDPSPASLDVRRRTYLSRADVTVGSDGKPELIPFGDFDGVQDVIRLYDNNTGTDWRVLAGGQGASGLRIGPDWQGTLRLRLSGQAMVSPEKPGAPANPIDILGIADPNPSLSLIAELDIGGQVTSQTAYSIEDDDDAVILSVTFPDIDVLQTRLAAATADTPLSLTLKFPRAAGSEPAVYALAPAPGVAIELPLTLDPGRRRVVPTRSRTIAFGDPAYDRVLASLTATAPVRVGNVEWRVAADRREYNRDSTLMLAFGPIDPITDTFDTENETGGTLKFQRIPLNAPGTTENLAVVLPGATAASKEVTLKAGNPVRLRLTDLRGTGPDPRAPLAPGDTLVLRLVAGDFKPILRVRIVAAPVIAPPASVYLVIESAPAYARTRLHAPGSLPTRIEFRHLTEDLARGHVRREALFVWHYSIPAGDDLNTLTSDLIKLDRSGGAQLPKDR